MATEQATRIRHRELSEMFSLDISIIFDFLFLIFYCFHFPFFIFHLSFVIICHLSFSRSTTNQPVARQARDVHEDNERDSK